MLMQYIWIFINQYCAIINKTQKLYFLKNVIFPHKKRGACKQNRRAELVISGANYVDIKDIRC